MSNLTQQIAGAYIGAQVEREGIIEPLLDACSFHLSEYKLILTPLSAISDEDKIQVGRILSENNELFSDSELSMMGGIFVLGAMTNLSIDFPFHVVKEAIDYLRSDKRPDGTTKPVYDLGYMGIRSLIAAGIAISSLDKTVEHGTTSNPSTEKA